MKPQDLQPFIDHDVEITLSDGSRLAGHFDDNEDGTIAFWTTQLRSMPPQTIVNFGAASDIDYNDIASVRLL